MLPHATLNTSVHRYQLRTVLTGMLVLLCCVTPVDAETDPVAGLSLMPGALRLFLGESTTVTVTLRISAATAIRNMRYPTVTAADVSFGEFSAPRMQEDYQDGVAVTSYEFTAGITPRTAGIHRIGPAHLTGEVSTPTDGPAGFFGASTYQEVNFSSTAMAIQVLPLPTFGRPADFSGVVGRYRMNVSADPINLQSGAPLTVMTVISGTGNLGEGGCPDVRPPGFKSYPAQARRTATALKCTQLLIPESRNATSVPRIRFVFFNTSTARFDVLQSSAIPLSFTENRPLYNSMTSSQAVQSLPVSAVASRQPLHWLYGSLLLLAGVGALCAMGRKRFCGIVRNIDGIQVPESASSIEAYICAAEQALSHNDVELFYLSVFRATVALQEEQPARAMIECSDLIAHCDAVRYGRYSPKRRDMAEMLASVKKLLPDAA